jgi:hypothetical protein
MFFGDPVAAFANTARALRPGRAPWHWCRGRSWPRNEWLLLVRRALAAGRSLPEPPGDAPGPFGLSDPDHGGAGPAAGGFGVVSVARCRGWSGWVPTAETRSTSSAGWAVTRGLLGRAGRRAPGWPALDELRAAAGRGHRHEDGVLLGRVGPG